MLLEIKITKDTIAPEERNNFILQTSEAHNRFLKLFFYQPIGPLGQNLE